MTRDHARGCGVPERADAAPVDAFRFRRALRRLPTGVAIVTAVADGEVAGMTVSSLTSVSLEPPILLVCLSDGARTTQAVQAVGRFGVSVLSSSQAPLAQLFATAGAQRPVGLGGSGGDAAPVVPGALVQAQCTVEAFNRVGDHVVFFGLVTTIEERSGTPLGFVDGRIGAIDLLGP